MYEKALRFGVAPEVTATPVKGLQLNYTAGYTDATYKTLKAAQADKKQICIADDKISHQI